MGPMVLFLENEDSFSWNVIDALPVDRAAIRVCQGREAAGQDLRGCRALVIGPGPTDPVRAGLVDVVHRAAAAGVPLLGICLGFQALGLAFGARLVRETPAHGVVDEALFEPSASFPGFAGPQVVMRYHSLALAEVRPPLRVVARTRTGIPMAVEHASLPLAGLQFHPDSYATPRGRELLAAFFAARAPGAP